MNSILIQPWVNVSLSVFLALLILVWALLMFGAWAANLENPQFFAKKIALKKKFADKIMQSLVVQLTAIITACGLLVTAYFKSQSSELALDEISIGLLSQVHRVTTPIAITDGINTLSKIPGTYQGTMQAYCEFLRSPDHPNLPLIEADLSDLKGRSVFDLRLLGLVNDLLAERMLVPQDKAIQEEYYKKASGFYSQAKVKLEQQKSKMPKDAAENFGNLLQSEIAGVDMGLGELKADKALLLQARDAYLKLRAETDDPISYLNLAGAESLLGQFDKNNFEDAINVLESASQIQNTSNRQLVEGGAKDLYRMHELQPLADYVFKTQNKKWPDFVNSLFPGQ